MTPEEIEGNRLIAEAVEYTNNYWYQNNCLRYHESWDWLIPAYNVCLLYYKKMPLRDDPKGFVPRFALKSFSWESDISCQLNIRTAWIKLLDFIKWIIQQPWYDLIKKECIEWHISITSNSTGREQV